MRWYTALPTAAVASGAAVTAYASLYERTRWTLRRFDVPGARPGLGAADACCSSPTCT